MCGRNPRLRLPVHLTEFTDPPRKFPVRASQGIASKSLYVGLNWPPAFAAIGRFLRSCLVNSLFAGNFNAETASHVPACTTRQSRQTNVSCASLNLLGFTVT